MVATHFLVDLRAVAGAGTLERASAMRARKPAPAVGMLAEELPRELQNARGVGDDLHGLNAGDVVKEPAATGVHELGVALHLHQLECAHALVV